MSGFSTGQRLTCWFVSVWVSWQFLTSVFSIFRNNNTLLTCIYFTSLSDRVRDWILWHYCWSRRIWYRWWRRRRGRSRRRQSWFPNARAARPPLLQIWVRHGKGVSPPKVLLLFLYSSFHFFFHLCLFLSSLY